jgi:outer membrane protein OmpA-like peptidoglycan-associated protein
MSSQDNDQDMRVVGVVLVSVILLAVGLAVGMGISKSRGAKPAAPAAAVVAAPVADGEPSVVVEAGVVKFYFASGKADLAAGAVQALGEAIAAAQAGKMLTISGFHDASGDPAMNAELAKQRALAVRDALMGAGVAEAAMELKKPEQMVGDGSAAEARRVEVVIAQ